MNHKINYIDEKEKYIALYRTSYDAAYEYVHNLPKNSDEEWELFNKMNNCYHLYPNSKPEWVGDENRIWMTEYLFYSTANVDMLVGSWLYWHNETAYTDFVDMMSKNAPYVPNTHECIKFPPETLQPKIIEEVKTILKEICYEWELAIIEERYEKEPEEEEER